MSNRSVPIVSIGARALRSGAYRNIMGAAGRKWNAMTSEQRHELLLQEWPASQASSKVSITRWQQLMQGHKVLIIILLQRRSA